MLVSAALVKASSICVLWADSQLSFRLCDFVILVCCRICLDIGYRNTCIHFCSDSQAALLALPKTVIESDLVVNCKLAEYRTFLNYMGDYHRYQAGYLGIQMLEVMR